MQFRPLDMWTGSMTKNRRRSTFKAPWMRTLRDLERETGHLKARDVVLSGAFRADQITQDNSRPRAGETPAHPGVVISFEAYIDGKYVPLKYPCDTFTDWQDNVRAIALALDALRRVDRYGVTKRAEQYRGWSALPPPGGLVTPPKMTLEEAERFMATAVDAPIESNRVRIDPEAFRYAYRAAAQRFHPDANGGSVSDTWYMLQVAADVLKRHHGIS